MNILIDGLLIDKPRGLGSYLRELIYAIDGTLTGMSGRHQVRVMVPDSVDPGLHVPGTQVVDFVAVTKRPLPVWEQFLLPSMARSTAADVVHFPYNTAASGLVRSGSLASVCTIHDLMMLNDVRDYSATAKQALGNLYRRALVLNVSRKATTIVTLTKSLKSEIECRLKRNVSQVYTNCSYLERAVAIRPYFSIPSRYILHIGGISPHKNTKGTIEAFMTSAAPNSSLLVLGTPPDCDLSRQYSSPKVAFLPTVSSGELKWLYENAEAVLFPSFDEGYGMPIIEAFGLGTVVITSNFGPMAELAGDAAITVDPYSADDLNRAIKAVQSPDFDRFTARSRMALRIEKLGIRRMGAMMIDLYEESARKASC